MPSRTSAALAALLLLGTAAPAQDTGRQRLETEGDAAMARMEGAVAKAKDSGRAVPDPNIPIEGNEAVKRRAFQGLKTRAAEPAMEARARAAAKAGEARLAAEREAQAKRLRQAFGLEPSETEALAHVGPPSTSKGFVPVIFASSSMPIATLRAYAAQLARVHGVLAFRGMPGGLRKVGPMAKLTAEILRLDPGCEGPDCVMRDVQVIVDPIVFRQHGIARVPALAMIPGDPTQAYCERDDESPRARYVVYGDSALPGLLDEYARLGGREEVRDAQALLASR
ncbi:type-F conjugative transfer system pilin assembly protein TrbC [Sphingobium sp. B2D3A]|uniref:type-F conjugative transfer system pilin assembly protein TrbC n=1 Tax=unclassified Sphingobium TaxID=2611147 RepID=UPI002224FA51|nr:MULTISPECIES: type-F conjugative transfer system pilin assembly protein TrbC [unclassified Sphingobium]MCW2338204.1 type-F conjugative transfer system pilin assembly protein TrbC [Sphingobium sp. B2D3A]MCW2384663.1 type-F conjugative transfer system pilin assembly protein TrbC [Sphingobium sp. B2D3D]